MFEIQVNMISSLGVAERAGIVMPAVFQEKNGDLASLDQAIIPPRPIASSSLLIMLGLTSMSPQGYQQAASQTWNGTSGNCTTHGRCNKRNLRPLAVARWP
jgi:hypothetical protein